MFLDRDIRGPASLLPLGLATVLALGWLLPNHYAPWNTFHNNAWIALALIAIGGWRLARDAGGVRVTAVGIVLASLALVPWLQHATGLLPLRGDALLSSVYLLGVAVAFVFGEHWGRLRPGAPADMVLGAALIAAIVSVGLQIYQWLGYAVDPAWYQFWIFTSAPSRPYANLGQPNQLASLLLWGVAGSAWAAWRGWLRPPVALAAAAFILFGVALTESRTAALTLTVAVAALTLRAPAFLLRRHVRVVQVLYVFYLVVLFGLEPLARLTGQADPALTVFQRSAGELRLTIWRMVLDAATQRPWFGYGWNQTNEAFLQVFPRHPGLANLYLEQSHNLVLDLVLWAGIPLALAAVLGAAWWLFRLVRATADTGQLVMLAALAVLIVHAMLELPLHHGYFLWPFALLAGAASARLQLPVLLEAPRRIAGALLAALAVVTALLVHDYLRVEHSFTELRLQLQHVGHGHDETPPPTVLLNEWSDFIAMSRTEPAPGMSPRQLQLWQDLMIYNTSPLAMRKVIGALTLNGRPEEARYWGIRSCALMHAKLCRNAQTEWTAPGTKPASSPSTPPAL